MSTAFLGLGSNLGDRLAHLALALRELRIHPAISLVQGSSVYESKPVGLTEQPDFLNLVVRIETTLPPLELLAVCLRIETALGRERRERWGPRTLDIDLLAYDDVVLGEERLTLPHPRMHERGFVLVPLAEIAPDFQVGGTNASELALRVGNEGLRPILAWKKIPPGVSVRVEEVSGSLKPEMIAAGLSDRQGFFYLDSARAEGNVRPAFSFIGFDPFLTWEAKAGTVIVKRDGTAEKIDREPLDHLRGLLSRFRSAEAPHGIPFAGGAVGCFGYEFGTRSEGVLPASAEVGTDFPEACFGFYDGVIACDLSSGKNYLVANPVANRSAEEIFAALREAIERVDKSIPAVVKVASQNSHLMGEPQPDMSRDEYLRRVRAVKEYIAAGDVYQVNLSQRFEMETAEKPYAVYQRLRALSPAPFGAYVDIGGAKILSSSPELFLRADHHGRLITRPIKGTRPRGKDADGDQRLKAELLSSEKDHAELLMIVDLERNDLGRVCRYGSVKVDERYRIEAHPTVFHLVATISGELAEGKNLFDGLRSMLPGGSITGAPKIRAMEIINELEPCGRGVYTGALGYLGFDGSCDLNIAIRTIVYRDGCASYHVGGGIVSDSDPESEYQETLTKGRAMRAALTGEGLS